MKVQKSLGAYAKVGEDFKDEDILVILDEGTIVEGDFGAKHVFQMRLPNSESKNVAVNKTSMNRLIDTYGDETVEWKGKNVKAWVIRQMVSGKMQNVVYLTAPNQTLED